MDIKVIQCPRCGGSLTSFEVGTHVFCSFCGAQLEIIRGASGTPMAALESIAVDTSFLAKERAKEHLRGRVAECEARIEALKAEGDVRISAIQRRSLRYGVLSGLGVFALSCAVSNALGSLGVGVCVGVVLCGITCARVSGQLMRKMLDPIQAEYRARITDLRSARALMLSDLKRIQEDLDRLARQV